MLQIMHVQEAQTMRIANVHESARGVVNSLVRECTYNFQYISEAVVWDFFRHLIALSQDAFSLYFLPSAATLKRISTSNLKWLRNTLF